jgi:hypothetical protein
MFLFGFGRRFGGYPLPGGVSRRGGFFIGSPILMLLSGLAAMLFRRRRRLGY